MNRLRSFLFILSAIIGISVVASAQNFAPAAKYSDASISQQIGKKLRGLHRSNVFDHITWQVNGGAVTLGGKVITLGTKREAASIVRHVPGVVSVVNNIDELPPSPFDDRIRRAALETFVSRGPAQYFGHPNPDVRIVVENGRMTLEGFVSRKSDSDLLNLLAQGVPGVFKVTNNLVIGKRAY